MDWFRSWHGRPTDLKWLVIARKANVAPGLVSAVAWALLDHASRHEDRGSVEGFDAESYAEYSGFSEQDVERVIEAMREKGVIDGDGRFAAWEKEQPKREEDSTERVRAFRERERKKTETNGNAPQRDETCGNDPQRDETQGNEPQRAETQGNAPDTDTERDTDKENAKESAPAAPATPPEKPDKPAKTARAPNAQYELAAALAEVCAMELEPNKPRLIAEAKKLKGCSPPPLPEEVRLRYGKEGWWWSDDWRGQRGEWPSPATVRETWGRWTKPAPTPARKGVNGHAKTGLGAAGGVPTREDPAQLARTKAQWDAWNAAQAGQPAPPS